MNVQHPRFTADDAQRAHDEWGANCGPGAMAAICGLTLEEARPHFEAHGFSAKHYTNPTMMFGVLTAVRARWRANVKGRKTAGATCTFVGWPRYGLARIQWEGPWTAPGSNPKWAYRQTHWVGVDHRGDSVGIFDINMMNNGSGWGSVENWESILVPWLLKECVPRADGNWHITHAIEVER